jgi:membrane protein
MALDASLGPSKDARSRDDEHPLWAAAAGVALLAIGFRLGLNAARRPRQEDGGGLASGRPANHDVARDELDVDRPLDRPAGSGALGTRRGWKDILVSVYRDIDKNHIVAMAAGVTFYSILALFPAMAALVAVYGLFADPAAIGSHLDTLSGVMPGGGVQIVGDELKRLTAQPRGTLGVTFAVGLVTALWSANSGIKGLFDALNLVYEVPEKRSFIRLNTVSLAFTAATIGFVMIALAVMVVAPIAFGYLGITAFAEELFRWLRWPGLLVAIMFWLAVLYRFGASRTNVVWRWVTWGSFIAAILWLIASGLFTWYTTNFGSYDKTYGSLGAVIGFMIWMWISTIVVLLGAAIDGEMEKAQGVHP